MPFWGLAVVGAALGLFYVVGEHMVRRRFAQAKTQRVGEGFPEFRDAFQSPIAEERLREVYVYFQRWAGDPHFPVRRTDSLAKLYGIVDDDIDRMVEKLALHTGQTPPRNWTRAQLETVGDVALLFTTGADRTDIGNDHEDAS
jgi:hypothetical protein